MFRLTDQAIDISAAAAALSDPHSGGFVEFRGCVRNHHHGRSVEQLHYSAYPALAITEGERILEEARQRYAIDAVACIHRTGDLQIGDTAVWVGVGAAHRDAAFAACRYVIDEVKRRLPVWKHERYLDGETQWVGCQGCADHDHDQRYDRQQRVPGVGEAGQQRLRQAHVAVVGVGALGCPVADLLAGAGVGRLTLIDPDRVELSNLHRQSLYAEADVGALKVDAARRRLLERNSSTVIDARPQALAAGSDTAWLDDADLVMDCSDDPVSKQWVTHRARVSGRPCIVGGVHQLAGGLYVSPRQAQDGVCWACISAQGSDCGDQGVLGPTPAVIGAAMAGEALRRLIGLDSALAGRWTVLDFGSGQFQRFVPKQRKTCRCLQEADGRSDAVQRDRLDPALHWIDLREVTERRLRPLPGAQPLAFDEAMAGRGLEPDQRYLLICTSGRRSEAVCHTLREQGFGQVWTLTGGVRALPDESTPLACSA